MGWEKLGLTKDFPSRYFPGCAPFLEEQQEDQMELPRLPRSENANQSAIRQIPKSAARLGQLSQIS